MLVHITIGGIAASAIFWLIGYTEKKQISLTWWHWLLTVLGILYAVFVLELIYGFLGERAPQAALVMGLITGIVAVIWGVLLGRFVFKKKGA